jgi:hypothetical protein
VLDRLAHDALLNAVSGPATRSVGMVPVRKESSVPPLARGGETALQHKASERLVASPVDAFGKPSAHPTDLSSCGGPLGTRDPGVRMRSEIFVVPRPSDGVG